MLTVDGLAETFRLYLLADPTLAAMVPGGWMYDRQRQSTAASLGKTGYGVIRVDYVGTTPSSSFVWRKYTVTTACYLTANSQDQEPYQTRLSDYVDFQATAIQAYVPNVPPSGILMVTPGEVGMKVADEMKQGSDVVPVMAAWLVTVVDQRAA